MSNELTTFTFNTSAIRVVTIDGNPWFVAADLCRVLYSDFNRYAGVSKYMQNVGADERMTVNRHTPGIPLDLFVGASAPSYVVLSESGLYKLALRSNKPTAKPFQDWVTKVVLPAIRKDGAYVMGEEKVATGELSEDEKMRPLCSQNVPDFLLGKTLKQFKRNFF